MNLLSSFIQTILSVSELHRIGHLKLWFADSTAGREFHPAPKMGILYHRPPYLATIIDTGEMAVASDDGNVVKFYLRGGEGACAKENAPVAFPATEARNSPGGMMKPTLAVYP